MDLSNILSINGKTGLFRIISQRKDSFIVESLADGKRFPAFSQDGVAILDNIAIFTDGEDATLASVFQSIFRKENGQKTPDVMGNDAQLKAYFAEILPNYDRERVYVSNMKKVILWYNLLVKHHLVDAGPKETNEKEENNQ